MEANNSLKESLKGKSSKQLSFDQSSTKKKKKPVDTQKEFITTINKQLHMAGAGIQVIIEESKDAQWFQKKREDEESRNLKYGLVNKWQVAPKTFD